MALVGVKVEKDEYGREQEIYCDTDDLSQEDYHEYCKLLEEGRSGKPERFLRDKLL